MVRDSGLYAVSGAEYLPMGFNAFRPTDGKLALGEIKPKDKLTSQTDYTIQCEDENLTSPDEEMTPETISVYSAWYSIDPSELRDSEDKDKAEQVIRNKRALMQLFDIKVFVYDDKAEIRGIIPPQFIDLKGLRRKGTAPVIGTGRGSGRWGTKPPAR